MLLAPEPDTLLSDITRLVQGFAPARDAQTNTWSVYTRGAGGGGEGKISATAASAAAASMTSA